MQAFFFSLLFVCYNRNGQNRVSLQSDIKQISYQKRTFSILQFCIGKGGILVELHNADESDDFNSFLTNTEANNSIDNSKRSYWIGLSDIKARDNFVWNSSLETVTSFTNWNSYQPDKSQDCVYTMTDSTRSWVVGDCNQNFFGVCQIGKII